MKNLKIGTKLLLTFMLVIVLFCVTVGAAIYGLTENANRYTEFYEVGYQITNKVMNMRRGLQIIVKDLAFVTMEEDQAKSDVHLSDMQKELSALEENANWLFANFTGDAELLNAFAAEITEAMELQQEVIDASQRDMQAAQNMLLNEYQPLIEEAVSTLIQISDIATQNADDSYQETVEMQKILVMALLGLAGGALVITLLLSTYLRLAITRPLHAIEISADQIVKGDFNISVTYESKDELGRLSKAFKNMVLILESVISDASRLLGEMADGNFDVRTRAEDRYVGSLQSLLLSMRKLNRSLSSTLGQINMSADQVSSGSDQVANGAQALAQGATEQAAAVEELASTIANISNQVKETADNALVAKRQSNTAGNEAEECNRQMQSMMEAMDEISRTSNEISKIIKTIEDISFQTNILALNASVEASRAGVAGKGFAVVANEVRALAGKSSDASKNTTKLIESSIKAVSRGTQIAHSTAESLTRVVEDVRSTSVNVDKIADAAEEQAGAIEQVTLGVNQISDVVQTNSATAEQSAAASHELSSQADTLKNLVAQFNLQKEYTGSSASAGRKSVNNISLD